MAPARLGAWRWLLAGLAGLGLAAVPSRLPAQSTSLAIDGSQSSARFIVNLRLKLRTEGRISKVAGEMQGDPVGGWTVLVAADGRSLKVSGPRWMDRATRSDDFLAVDSHPDIRFRSEPFSDAVLHEGGRIAGELTLRGLTRAVSFRLLPSACANPGRDCDLQVHGTISRTEFGMTAHRFSVRDDVLLQMRVRLQAAGGAAQ